MKLKYTAILGVVTILFVAALIWLTNQFLMNDRQSFAETQSRTSVSALAEVIEAEIRFLKNWTSSADANSLQRINWEQMVPYVYVARVDKAGTEWKIAEETVKPGQALAGADRRNIIADFNFQGPDVGNSNLQISSMTDRQKNQYVGLLVSVPLQSTWLFVHQGESLQSLIDKQKLSRHTFGVVALNSMVIAHSLKEYVGQKIAANSLFQKMIKDQLPQGSGLFKLDQNQSQYAYYLRVPQTNVYVFSSLPLSALMDGQNSLWFQIGAFGAGFILILVSLSAVFKKEDDTKLPPRPLSGASAVAGVGVVSGAKSGAPVVRANTASGIELSTKDRTDAYIKMASSLGHEMKSPLVHVLGYGQMLLGKTTDPESKAMIESLMKQARQGKDIVEKLFSFAGEKNNPKVKGSLAGPLNKSLKNIELQLSAKQIKLTKDLQISTELMIDPDALSKAFDAVLSNAMESVEKQTQKEIKIKAEELDGKTVISISDTGEGVPFESQKKVFDPFFSTKKKDLHMGLGLSTALGILRDHDGDIEMDSKPGQGTTMKLSIPKEKMNSQVSIPNLKAEFVPPAPKNPTPTISLGKPKVEPPTATPLDLGQMPTLNIPFSDVVTFSGATKAGAAEKPSEVNLDQLLSMPDVNEAAASATQAREILEAKSKGTELPPLEEKSTASKPLVNLAPAAATTSTPPLPKPKVAPVAKVESLDLPTKEVGNKKTELDEFKFSIRRPGKKT